MTNIGIEKEHNVEERYYTVDKIAQMLDMHPKTI
jgi:hypothetical protein